MKSFFAVVGLIVLIGLSIGAQGSGESKEKIKEAAVAVKEDAKELIGKVSDEVKKAAKKTKEKIHEETK